MTLPEIITELEACGYACEAGPLERNRAWIALKAMASNGDIESRFNSGGFIGNVCLSYRHDFGLMAEKEKDVLIFECKEWMRAILNNWDYFKEIPTE